jgi:Recombination directionality factor-like
MANAIMTVYGGPPVSATVLGQGATRIPTAGKIRAGIKVLSRAAADEPRARELYEQGVAAGQSFEQIEKAIADALPKLKTPLVPRNVAWFTVRGRDFANPALAEQLLDAHGEDRGKGRRLYRFPVVFPSDHWQTVMPHELAAWGAHEKHYWSAYSPDGRVRHCLCHAPVPLVDNGKRAIRIFGGRKTMLREDNGGVCEPEACREYQLKQCNLSGRFLFFVPGIRSVSAFELHTNSFYAMNTAIQTFETIGFLRGGRISGFLDRQRTPFYFSKRLMEVSHIDEQGRAVRVPQWIIELQAPVDVAALLREHEDDDTAIVQADAASHVLEQIEPAAQVVQDGAAAGDPEGPTPGQDGEPSADKVLARALASGVAAERFEAYADRRWGSGWKLNRLGRRRAWDELERYRNDPQGYADKVDTEMKEAS